MKIAAGLSRALLTTCAAWLLGVSALRAQDTAAAADPQPPLNFVFFLVDDLGWTDLACFGSSFYETPNIDGLAASGMRFTQAYAACPVCSPTRASILTGKYPGRTGITDYINSGRWNQPEKWRRNSTLLPAPYVDRMALEEVTLAEALKEAGYATFFAGKWHLGVEGFWPTDQGFDVNAGGTEGGGPYGGKRYFSPYGNPNLKDGPDGEHLPARLAAETVAFITEHKDEPFLAYLSFYSVHTPLMARADLKKKYEAKAESAPAIVWGKEGQRKVREVQRHAVYAGMIEAMDSAVGHVLESLGELGLAERTAVLFMSDNGGLSTSEGHPTSNLPLRGGKGWLYEGGIREPMIVRWPGVTKAQSLCTVPVMSTDFYPTMLEMAGLQQRPEQHVDGVSITSLLRGAEELEERDLYWHYPHYGNQGGFPGGAIRSGPWKFIEEFGSERVELYNIEDDPEESRDLSSAQPARVAKMQAQLHAWQKANGVLFPSPNPRYKAK